MTECSKLLAVVFDLDGLIANTEDLYERAGETVLLRRGKTYDAELREKMMGRPAVDALRIMIDCHALPDSLDDLMSECKEVLQNVLEASLEAMPGLYDLLDDLRMARRTDRGRYKWHARLRRLRADRPECQEPISIRADGRRHSPRQAQPRRLLARVRGAWNWRRDR